MITNERGSSGLASRFDIMKVIADLKAIYIRATNGLDTTFTQISDCRLGTVSSRRPSPVEVVFDVEICSCPVGYEGLSCEVRFSTLIISFSH